MKRTNAPASADTTSGWAWYAVGVLLLAYIFSIMDRQILTLLVGPIQETLGANDTSMGLLHGFTFAAFYAVMGLPIARMIDRGHRPVIIAVGIAVWSVATAASGLATDFVHLVAARTCVAVGEAVLIPGAVSLLADLFSPDKRGRAMGVFGTGAPVGAGVGLLAGGLLLGLFTMSPAVLPFLGELLPWQATFIAVGLPGVVIAVLMLFVPEPRRKGVARKSPTEGLPVSVIVDFLRSHRKTFTAIMLGSGFLYLAIYGWLGWTPTYFVRVIDAFTIATAVEPGHRDDSAIGLVRVVVLERLVRVERVLGQRERAARGGGPRVHQGRLDHGVALRRAPELRRARP